MKGMYLYMFIYILKRLLEFSDLCPRSCFHCSVTFVVVSEEKKKRACNEEQQCFNT